MNLTLRLKNAIRKLYNIIFESTHAFKATVTWEQAGIIHFQTDGVKH